MKVKLKKLKENAIVPTKGSKEAAGYDLYSCIDKELIIKPHETVLIGTRLSIELPKGYFGAVVARSGMAYKQGLAPANKFGVIDSDYRGECKVALHNHSNISQVVKPNDRIAQLIVLPCLNIEFTEYDKLNDTKRGANGFGSTGK